MRSKDRKPDLFHYKVISAIFFAIVFYNLLTTGFNVTEDSNCWLRISSFILDTNYPIKTHCVFNPVIPFLALFVSRFTGAYLENAYVVINYVSLFLATILLYKYAKRFTNSKIALWTTLLFLTHFQTFMFAFVVQTEAFMWLILLILLNYSHQLYLQSVPVSLKQIILLATISTITILTKTSLGFLLPTFPLIFLLKKKNWFVKSFLYSFLTLGPVFLVYYWGYSHTGALPWSSLQEGSSVLQPTIKDHIIHAVAPIFYIIPLFGIGIYKYLQNVKINPVILANISGLMVSFIIWPYVSSRFYFLLFPFFLLLSAQGMEVFLKKISLRQQFYSLTSALIIVAHFLTNQFRVFLILSNQTHLEFVKSLMEKL